MLVTVSGYTRFKTFRVVRSVLVDGRWMYELEDPDTNSSWDNGTLFPGTALEDE
jgi:hypothetical protein